VVHPILGYVHNKWLLILFINIFLTTVHCTRKYAIVTSSQNYLSIMLQCEFTPQSYYRSLPSPDSIHHHTLTHASYSPSDILLYFLSYIFIHTNRDNPITKVDKFSPKTRYKSGQNVPNPTVYNHFMPFVHWSTAHPCVTVFDSLTFSFVMCYGPYFSCLLPFDIPLD
jgi:hypothetical protein